MTSNEEHRQQIELLKRKIASPQTSTADKQMLRQIVRTLQRIRGR